VNSQRKTYATDSGVLGPPQTEEMLDKRRDLLEKKIESEHNKAVQLNKAGKKTGELWVVLLLESVGRKCVKVLTLSPATVPCPPTRPLASCLIHRSRP
jgi:hypothetical protein